LDQQNVRIRLQGVQEGFPASPNVYGEDLGFSFAT